MLDALSWHCSMVRSVCACIVQSQLVCRLAHESKPLADSKWSETARKWQMFTLGYKCLMMLYRPADKMPQLG